MPWAKGLSRILASWLAPALGWIQEYNLFPFGLTVPYHEKHTPDLFKIERCEEEADFFEFWQRYPNMDHFTCKHVERQQFIRDDVPNL